MNEVRIVEQLPSETNEILALRYCVEEVATATFTLMQMRGDMGLTMEQPCSLSANIELAEGEHEARVDSPTVAAAELTITFPDDFTIEKIVFNSDPGAGKKYINWQRFNGEQLATGANDEIDGGERDLAQELIDLRNFNTWLEAIHAASPQQN